MITYDELTGLSSHENKTAQKQTKNS